MPTAPRTLTTPLASLTTPPLLEHNVYFGEFDMRLDPQDDQPGFVVGELRADGDGWFNYFGFPDQPFGTPFTFSHSGKVVKALTYGNLGTGGLSKAAFEQSPAFGFEPGYGTHLIEHRAIDAAGNIGNPGAFKATVIPGASPACTTTITGKRSKGVTVESGVTCIAGATIDGPVTVEPGASLVVSDGSRAPQGPARDDAAVVHVFGATVNRDSKITGTTDDVIVAGSLFRGKLTVVGQQGQQLRRRDPWQQGQRQADLHRQRPGRHRLRGAEQRRGEDGGSVRRALGS